MDDLPDLDPGFTRLAVWLKRGHTVTPGAVASSLGIDLDQLGPVLIHEDQVTVDVANDFVNRAGAALEQLGPVQEIGRKVIPVEFCWLQLAVGRNHGLTMAHVRKILTRADAGPLGRIKVNNTHTLVGLRDDHIDAVIERLSSARINGVAAKPHQPDASSIHESPAFKRVPR